MSCVLAGRRDKHTNDRQHHMPSIVCVLTISILELGPDALLQFACRIELCKIRPISIFHRLIFNSVWSFCFPRSQSIANVRKGVDNRLWYFRLLIGVPETKQQHNDDIYANQDQLRSLVMHSNLGLADQPKLANQRIRPTIE